MNRRTSELTLGWIFLAFSIACFVVHFIFFRHSFPPVNTDEGSFFSPAKSLAGKGLLASDIHKSFLPGSSVYTYWMPPLYLLLLGGFLKIFGSTVIAAKVLSLLLSCGSVLLLITYAKTSFSKVVAAVLFLVCPFIIITSAFIRVEALAIFITLLAIVGVRNNWHVAWLGIIAGLGIMTHPLMLACGAGLALVAVRRGFIPFLLFSAAFLLIISPYLWYIFQDVELFKEQMTLQFLRKSKAKLLDLQPMYILQSVPMILIVLYCLYKVKAQNELRLFLTVASILSLIIILKSNEFNYQVYLVPYAIAAVVLAAEEKREQRLFRLYLPLLLCLFFVGLLGLKLRKYHFRTDATYNELVTQLEKDKTWIGKNIFEAGGPDLSTHLLMEGQNVERQIPVPQTLPADWFGKYNYVIEVRDNGSNSEGVFEEKDKPRPWAAWPSRSYTTSDSAYTMTQFWR